MNRQEVNLRRLGGALLGALGIALLLWGILVGNWIRRVVRTGEAAASDANLGPAVVFAGLIFLLGATMAIVSWRLLRRGPDSQ